MPGTPVMPLKVNEIFYSIQGESSFAGRRCVFVRLTGCNLRCSYCDTRYAYTEGQEMSVAAVVDAVTSFRCPLVEVTGGEPLIQRDSPALIERLENMGLTVLLETNGTQDIARIRGRCVRIVDVKCPSSGESAKNDSANLDKLKDDDELKLVIGDSRDYAYAKEILGRLPERFTKKGTVHLSPAFGRLAPERLADWILRDCLDVHLQLQIHKYIWPPTKRGV